MTAKHTPGPWHLGPHGQYVRHRFAEVAPNICDLSVFNGPSDEAKANARLIAAAPDLLAACNAAVRYDESIAGRAVRGEVSLREAGGAVASGDDLDSLYAAWIDAARAALAKVAA